MPLLVMRSYPDTLLDESCRMAVRRQMDYAVAARVPVGHLRVGLRRWSIATVTTSTRRSASPVSASSAGWATSSWWRRTRRHSRDMIDPVAAAMNLRRLAAAGLEGAYGAFDAIDYTPRRDEDADDGAMSSACARGMVIRTYLAHH